MTAQKAQTDRKRIMIAGGSLLAVALLATAAAFTDFANLNLGNGAGGGIGGDNRFNIEVVGTDATGAPVPGTWQDANTVEGVDILVVGAEEITPGDTLGVEIPFRNESPKLSADIDFKLQDRPNLTSDPEMRDLLRYTVTLDGNAIATNQTQDQVNALDLGVYPAKAEATLALSITLPDQGSQAANNALQGKVSYVQAHFNAESVTP